MTPTQLSIFGLKSVKLLLYEFYSALNNCGSTVSPPREMMFLFLNYVFLKACFIDMLTLCAAVELVFLSHK